MFVHIACRIHLGCLSRVVVIRRANFQLVDSQDSESQDFHSLDDALIYCPHGGEIDIMTAGK